MKLYKNLTATVEQLIRDLTPIVKTDPNKKLDFDFCGTQFFISGVRTWPGTEDLILLNASSEYGSPVRFVLENLQEKKHTAKVLLRCNWMFFDLQANSDGSIFQYCNSGKVLFEWEACDIRLLSALQLKNSLQSLSDKYPDRKVVYLDEDEKVHYVHNPKYIANYGIYVARECDAADCATAASFIKGLPRDSSYAHKGVVVYHEKQSYKAIRFVPSCVFFNDKDGDEDVIAFRLERRIRDNNACYSSDSYSEENYELHYWLAGLTYRHEFVDLGLSVNWATCNIGAKKPEESGDYYAWGEVEPKVFLRNRGGCHDQERKPCTKDNYKFYYKGHYTKYCSGSSTLEPCNDAAHVKWGKGWRMPTKEEFEELIQKCKWKWTEKNCYEGYEVTGPNGNSIFMPAAGYYTNQRLWSFDEDSSSPWNDYFREYGLYWSSTGDDCAEDASILEFCRSSKVIRLKGETRYRGIPVRAVYPKNNAMNPSKKILDILNEHPDALADWGFKNPVESPDGLEFDIYTTCYHPGWVRVEYDEAEGTYIISAHDTEYGYKQEVGFIQESELFDILDKEIREGLTDEEIEEIRKRWWSLPQ